MAIQTKHLREIPRQFVKQVKAIADGSGIHEETVS